VFEGIVFTVVSAIIGWIGTWYYKVREVKSCASSSIGKRRYSPSCQSQW